MATFLSKFGRVSIGIIIFAIGCSMFTKLVVFPDEKIMLYPYPSSMRRVESRCWLFCDKVAIDSQSWNSNFEACLYNSPPAVGSRRVLHNFSKLVHLSRSKHQAWAFFLNKGSNMAIFMQVGMYSRLDIVIIKGEKNYSSWVIAAYSQKYVLVQKKVTCIPGMCHFKYDVKTTEDVYYFILKSGSHSVKPVNAQLIISSLAFHKSKAIQCCSSRYGRCHLHLPTKHLHVIGVSVRNAVGAASLSTRLLGTFRVTVTWEPRIWVYTVAFLAIPTACAIIICLLIACVQMCGPDKQVDQHKTKGDRVEPRPGQPAQPPPYTEDRPLLNATRTNATPSYGDATNSPPPPYR